MPAQVALRKKKPLKAVRNKTAPKMPIKRMPMKKKPAKAAEAAIRTAPEVLIKKKLVKAAEAATRTAPEVLIKKNKPFIDPF